jgi:hypothetical protein
MLDSKYFDADFTVFGLGQTGWYLFDGIGGA